MHSTHLYFGPFCDYLLYLLYSAFSFEYFIYIADIMHYSKLSECNFL